MFQIRFFLAPKMPGSKSHKVKNLQRAAIMQKMIVEKFGHQFDDPHKWKFKHIRSVLDAKAAGSKSTAYDYYRTARIILAACGRWSDEADKNLAGPWVKNRIGNSRMGRRALLPGGTARVVN